MTTQLIVPPGATADLVIVTREGTFTLERKEKEPEKPTNPGVKRTPWTLPGGYL